MSRYVLKPVRQTTSQNLTGGALSFTYTMTKDGWFNWVGIKFSGGVSETVTVTFDSADGSNYDVPINAETLSSGTSYRHQPASPVLLKSGDAITVTCTNATATQTAYLTAFFTEVETWI